jgi:hypothetical protein
MVWPLLIMGAVSALGASQQRNQEQKAAAGDSKAQREANSKNFANTALHAGLLNVQKAQQKKELQQAKADIGASELQALSTAGNNAAASGTIGASVDAVQTDIQQAFDRQRALVSEENEANAQNFNSELYDLITNGSRAINPGRKVKSASDLAIAANTALQIGSRYYGAKMDLGLGSSPSGGTDTFGSSVGNYLSR